MDVDLNEGHPANLGTAWDIEVDILMSKFGASLQTARDFVILQWLIGGDTRPYSAFVVREHLPAPQVVVYLAWMLNPREGTEKNIPYRLEIGQRGKRGRPHNLEVRVRNKLIYEQMKILMSANVSYDSALDHIDDFFPGQQRETIEKAYKQECLKRRGN